MQCYLWTSFPTSSPEEMQPSGIRKGNQPRLTAPQIWELGLHKDQTFFPFTFEILPTTHPKWGLKYRNKKLSVTKVLSVYCWGYFTGWTEFHELTGHQAGSSSFHASETAPSLGSALSRLLFKEGTAPVQRTFQLSPEMAMAKSQGLQLPRDLYSALDCHQLI